MDALGDIVRTLTRRHRRKAGSGPPADALIAWIGTDPYLRDAITTASHRREYVLPLPHRSRSAAAAMAICCVLACGAAVGITQIISHGRASQQATARPLVAGKESTAARHGKKPAPSAEAFPVLSAGGASPPGAYPTPAAMAPMVMEPGLAPQSKLMPAPTSDAAIASAADSSFALPTIGDPRTDHGPDRPVSTAAQGGQPLDPYPPDPAHQPSARAPAEDSSKVVRSVPQIDASKGPTLAAPHIRPIPRDTGTSTGVPQHATATDETDHTGASQPQPSERRSINRLASNGFQGAPSHLGARARTGEPLSRAGSNRSARAALTAH